MNRLFDNKDNLPVHYTHYNSLIQMFYLQSGRFINKIDYIYEHWASWQTRESLFVVVKDIVYR